MISLECGCQQRKNVKIRGGLFKKTKTLSGPGIISSGQSGSPLYIENKTGSGTIYRILSKVLTFSQIIKEALARRSRRSENESEPHNPNNDSLSGRPFPCLVFGS